MQANLLMIEISSDHESAKILLKSLEYIYPAISDQFFSAITINDYLIMKTLADSPPWTSKKYLLGKKVYSKSIQEYDKIKNKDKERTKKKKTVADRLLTNTKKTNKFFPFECSVDDEKRKNEKTIIIFKN